MDASNDARNVHVRRGTKLEHFTIAYNSLEGMVSVAAGLFAGSVSLIGFGFDSLIEVTSGGASALASPSRCGCSPPGESRKDDASNYRLVFRRTLDLYTI